MDHYRQPRHKKKLSENETDAVMDNPSCGDRVALQIIRKDGFIKELLFDGEGCSISMASASILAELISGRSMEEAVSICRDIISIFKGKNPAESLEKYGEIAALTELIQSPVRRKCATLAWQTLEILLKKDSS